MKSIFTIHQASNGILLTDGEYTEVIENTHDRFGYNKKDNIEEGLGSYFFNIIEKEMRQDQSSSFKVEINITKIE